MKLTLATVSRVRSCGSGSSFQDSLRFGTGLGGTGFDLVGESSSFSVTTLGTTGQIWFRIESAQDMGGRAGRLYISYAAGDTPYWQKDYLNPQSYGHILLSSFRVTDPGSYTVHAYLVEQGRSWHRQGDSRHRRASRYDAVDPVVEPTPSASAEQG